MSLGWGNSHPVWEQDLLAQNTTSRKRTKMCTDKPCKAAGAFGKAVEPRGRAQASGAARLGLQPESNPIAHSAKAHLVSIWLGSGPGPGAAQLYPHPLNTADVARTPESTVEL